MERGDRCVVVRLRNQSVLVKLLGPFGVNLRQLQSRLRIGQISLVLIQRKLIGRCVDLSEDVAQFHPRIEIHEDIGDNAGNLTADLDIDNRRQIAVGRHHLGDFAFGDRRGFEIERRIFRTCHVSDCANGYAREDHADQQPFQPARPFLSCHWLHPCVENPEPKLERAKCLRIKGRSRSVSARRRAP